MREAEGKAEEGRLRGIAGALPEQHQRRGGEHRQRGDADRREAGDGGGTGQRGDQQADEEYATLGRRRVRH